MQGSPSPIAIDGGKYDKHWLQRSYSNPVNHTGLLKTEVKTIFAKQNMTCPKTQTHDSPCTAFPQQRLHCTHFRASGYSKNFQANINITSPKQTSLFIIKTKNIKQQLQCQQFLSRKQWRKKQNFYVSYTSNELCIQPFLKQPGKGHSKMTFNSRWLLNTDTFVLLQKTFGIQNIDL